MPAFLCFDGDRNNEKKIQIEEDVVRIGTGSECRVQLSAQGVATHAATIEFRNGKYLFHNRSDHPVLLAGKSVPSRSPGVPWAPGEKVQLATDVVLVLETTGDPRPIKKNDSLGLGQAGITVPQKSANTKPPEKSWMSLTNLLILCYMLVIPILWLISSKFLNPQTMNSQDWAAEYEVVINDLIVLEKEKKDVKLRAYREHLQAAREAELRGYPNTSNALYSDLVSNLQEEKIRESTSKTSNNPNQAVYTRMMEIARSKLSPQKNP